MQRSKKSLEVRHGLRVKASCAGILGHCISQVTVVSNDHARLPLVSIVRPVHWYDLMGRQPKKKRQNAARDMSDLGLYLLFFVPHR